MATISTSGIGTQQIIRSEHLLRIINALDGTVPSDITVNGYLRSNGGLTISGSSTVTGSFSISGSNTLIGTKTVTGSVIATQGFTGSLFGSSSYAEAARTVGITTQDTTPLTYNITFTGGSSGNHSLAIDTTALTYNPFTSIFTTPIISTNSVNIANILTLTPTSSLPTGQPTGSFIVSGSGANCKPYFYNGTTWTALF